MKTIEAKTILQTYKIYNEVAQEKMQDKYNEAVEYLVNSSVKLSQIAKLLQQIFDDETGINQSANLIKMKHILEDYK